MLFLNRKVLENCDGFAIPFLRNFIHNVEMGMMNHDHVLQANYQAISDKLQEQESDRIQLVQRIKELQEKVDNTF